MKCSVWTLVTLGYLGVAFATFGYNWNHSVAEQRCYVASPDKCFADEGARNGRAILTGAVWPIYWAGVIALKLTA